MRFKDYCKSKGIVVDTEKIVFTERGERDKKRTHITVEMIQDAIANPTKIEQENDKIFIVRAKKTLKTKLEVRDDSAILIHRIEYNKVQFFG